MSWGEANDQRPTLVQLAEAQHKLNAIEAYAEDRARHGKRNDIVGSARIASDLFKLLGVEHDWDNDPEPWEDSALKALGESRARYGDLEARVTELEAERDAYRKGFDGSEMLRKAVEAERDSLAAVIEKVRETLQLPLDPEKVLDIHAGRALWKAWLNGRALEILAAVPSGVLAERDDYDTHRPTCDALEPNHTPDMRSAVPGRKPMSEYTPTTEQVREAYQQIVTEPGGVYERYVKREAEFERWLAEVKREAAAQAFEDAAAKVRADMRAHLADYLDDRAAAIRREGREQ